MSSPTLPCAAAPLHDPLTGKLLGVVDLSGPAHTVHAGTLSLVNIAARLAELEIRSAHQERLAMLRAVAAPMLARMDGKALVVAQDGAVAAVTGFTVSEFVPLPDDMAAGAVWLPALGQVMTEPLRGGWLLHLQDDVIGAGEHEGTSMVLDLSATQPSLRVSGPSGSWSLTPSPRHVEILLSLVRHPTGRSAVELAVDLFADPSRTVTVRAEMSRLRRNLGTLLQHKPYRIAAGIETHLLLPVNVATLMSASSAPIVTAIRAG